MQSVMVLDMWHQVQMEKENLTKNWKTDKVAMVGDGNKRAPSLGQMSELQSENC